MRLSTTALLVLALSFVGCGGDSRPSEPAAGSSAVESAQPSAPAAAQNQRQYVTTLDEFPDWVPLPDEYVVIMAGKAGGARSTVIETSGDPREVVAHLNAKLTARGLENIAIREGRDRFIAQGVINHELKHAVINISEYDAGGAMKPGNTTSISYMIGG
ncbi:MAG: hypothetical protein H0X67_21630 [Acidobacteria bacterium]|nr:hypothetical protein [Acidobacteriota bacterium]